MLIVNNIESSAAILRAIVEYERVFAKRPIGILRADNPEHAQSIQECAKKYGITSVPVLITAGSENKKIVGQTAICAFIPQMARAVATGCDNTTHRAPSERARTPPSFDEHKLRVMAEDGDDEPETSASLNRRAEQYKRAMRQRHAQVVPDEQLDGDDETNQKAKPANAAPKTKMPSAPMKMPDSSGPSLQMPRAAKKSAPTEDPFENRFMEMMETNAGTN